MLPHANKSPSTIDIRPSKETIISEKCVTRGIIAEVEGLTNETEEEITSLEDHIFCAFLGYFAEYSIPQSEKLVQPNPPKYVDCTAESKIEISVGQFTATSSGSAPPLQENTRKSEETPLTKSPSKSSKRKSRTSRISRQSKRSSTKSEKVINVINPEDNVSEATKSVQNEPVEIEDPYEINFAHIYTVTGENPDLMKELMKYKVSFDFLNGNSFEGSICFNNQEGSGFYRWSNGASFEGEFTSDVPNGRGQMWWPNGFRYEGNVKDGLRNGTGSLVFSIYGKVNSYYNGTWVDGFKNGKGILKHTDNDWYEGDFQEGMSNGQGLRQYPSGGKYFGQWKNGKQNGTGIMLFPNNDMYLGEWSDGKMEGKGKYMWNTFLNNQFVFPMHNTYLGMWKQGMRHGVGSLILSSGAIISTIWNENKKNGRGRVLCINGAIIESDPLFVNDNLVSIKNSEYRSEDVAYDLEKEANDRQAEIKDILDEWNTENSKCTLEPYKACTIPINIPPYFMNINVHLNKFFQLHDWYKRLTPIDWCLWSVDMPPLCTMRNAELVEEKTEDKKQRRTTFRINKLDLPNPARRTTLIERQIKTPPVKLREKSKDDKCIHYISTGKSLTTASKSKSINNYDSKQTHDANSLHEKTVESNEHDIEEYMGRIYLFEKKWLRNSIIKHKTLLQIIYTKYATLCCKEKPDFEVGLLRILLWKLLKDVDFHKTGFSLVEIDRMAVGKSDPFDFVSVSEMIHYLLILAWELYTKNNDVSRNTPGIVAGGFDKFVTEKVVPLSCEEEICISLFPNCDKIPLEALYRLYQSLGTKLTVKKFILFLTRNTSIEHDKHKIALLPEPNEYFSFTLQGQNAILPGGEIIYKASKLPDFEYAEPPKQLHSVNMDFFGILGPEAIINVVIKCCPQISNNKGEILQQHYEICFLEFLDILSQLINTYLEYRMRFKTDLNNENKIRLINACLDEMLTTCKTNSSVQSSTENVFDCKPSNRE